jgi:hypothetical protein
MVFTAALRVRRSVVTVGDEMLHRLVMKKRCVDKENRLC